MTMLVLPSRRVRLRSNSLFRPVRINIGEDGRHGLPLGLRHAGGGAIDRRVGGFCRGHRRRAHSSGGRHRENLCLTSKTHVYRIGCAQSGRVLGCRVAWSGQSECTSTLKSRNSPCTASVKLSTAIAARVGRSSRFDPSAPAIPEASPSSLALRCSLLAKHGTASRCAVTARDNICTLTSAHKLAFSTIDLVYRPSTPLQQSFRSESASNHPRYTFVRATLIYRDNAHPYTAPSA
jgi:hypothetical protein